MDRDPTRLREQPALTTSTGRIWLVVGGLFALVALGVLIPLTYLPPPGLALVGAILVVVLYAAMVIARVVTPPGRTRLGFLAGAMIAMAAITLGFVLIIAASAWTPTG